LKSLHILHSEAAVGWGGQEIRIIQETRMLLERGHRVSIVCQPGSPIEERCGAITHPEFNYYPVAMPRPVSPTAFAGLVRLIKKIKPDILHTHSSIDSWLVSFIGKLLGIPIIRSRHVSIPVKNHFPTNWFYSNFPERILTSGEAIRKIMTQLNGVTEEQVVSIPAGVDMRRFDPSISGEKIRAELGLNPEQPLIGKIGVIRGWKGHNYFLEAVPLVLEHFPDAKFIIAGAGPGYEEIKERSRAPKIKGAVTVMGHREDIPEIIAAMNILVLASFAGEGTSQVIPQAFAMKTPVVATRGGSIAELFRDGERGVLADIKSGKSLADGIVKILKNPEWAEKLAKNAYGYCRKELTWDRKMDQTLKVYNDALDSYHK
jgi:glycosyltransferase involved in cell wall biosynthesis